MLISYFFADVRETRNGRIVPLGETLFVVGCKKQNCVLVQELG